MFLWEVNTIVGAGGEGEGEGVYADQTFGHNASAQQRKWQTLFLFCFGKLPSSDFVFCQNNKMSAVAWDHSTTLCLLNMWLHVCYCAAAVETDVKNPEETVSIREAYRQLWEVVKLPAVRRFAVVLVTFR